MKRLLYFTSLFLMVVFGCKQKPAQEETPVVVENEAAKAMFAKLPSPMEVSARIQLTGAEFNPAFLSVTDNAAMVSADTNTYKIAAYLGIYLSDLGYCIAYQQKDDVQKYYQAASLLADSLGVKKDLLGYLMKRYDQNLENNDSLKSVFTDLYNSSTNELSKGDMITIKGIVASAMYVESLHTLLAIIETFPKDLLPDQSKNIILAPVFKLIFNQKENVNNIHLYLDEALKTSPKMEFYDRSFNELTQLYGRLQIEDKIANNDLPDLFRDEVIQELIFRVSNIRNEVLKMPAM